MNHLTANDTDPFSESVLAALGSKLEMEILEIHENLTRISMPVAGNTQVMGALHGGATAALCETAASLAAMAHARTLGQRLVAVGTELSVSHVRSAREGIVTATAEAVHLGRTSTVHVVKVTDGQGNVVSTALASNRIIELR